jgi:hypothetical protein
VARRVVELRERENNGSGRRGVVRGRGVMDVRTLWTFLSILRFRDDRGDK